MGQTDNHINLFESEETAVVVRMELENFYKKNKREFLDNTTAQIKKVLSEIKKEDDDIKLINLVGKFFGFLEIPDLHEDFINHIMGLL